MNMCQSCAMPMVRDEDYGTEKGGGKNRDYCIYCYKDGDFTQDMSMEEMIKHCSRFLDEFNKHAKDKITVDAAIAQMREHFPKLKRWAGK